MIVISDTTPIISLIKIEKLNLLKELYEQIIIPEAVFSELTSNHDFENEISIVKNCDFIRTAKVVNTETLDVLKKISGLDSGESESIVLYDECNANLLLIDERKGRKVATQLGIKIIGTVGIMMQAFDKGLLTPSEIKSDLQKLISSDIRFSKSLCNRILNYIGEKK